MARRKGKDWKGVRKQVRGGKRRERKKTKPQVNKKK